MPYRHLQISEQTQQVIADGAAGLSVGAAGYAWLAAANEVAQLVASIVAIVAGGAAAWWHIERIRMARAERRGKTNDDDSV